MASHLWLSLCHRRPGVVVAYGLLTLAASLAFLFAEPPERTLFWNAVLDVGHSCLFAFLTFAALHLVQLAEPEHPGRRRAGAATVLVVVAGLSELLQLLQPSRDPSFMDFVHDLAGIACTFLLYPGVWARGGPAVLRRRFAAAGVALLVVVTVVVLPFAFVVRGYIARDRAFPALCVLDGSEWERSFVRVGGGVLVPAPSVPPGLDDARGLATLQLNAGTPYAGLALDEPYPDWRGYKTLVLTVASDRPTPIHLRVRIRDRGFNGKDDDTFFTSLTVTSTPRTLEIPLAEIEGAPRGRRMDLRRIGGVAIYVAGLEAPLRLSLGGIRLQDRQVLDNPRESAAP